MNRVRLTLCLAFASVSVVAQAKVEFGTPFSNNAVLQRGMAVPIWGKASPNEKVKVTFGDQAIETTADEKGSWRVNLKPMEASKEERELRANETFVSGVLVGEVWFASGQSNMECPVWTMRPRYGDANGSLALQMTRLPNVRVAKISVHSSTDDKPLPARAGWEKLVNQKKSKWFSAIAFYYARELYLALDVPIGIIDASYGGSNIDAWIPRSALNECDEAIRYVADYKVTIPWKKELAKGPINSEENQPCVLWNGMVAAWAPMAMRGFIWYQGCCNTRSDANNYCSRMRALYKGWSKEFENPNLKLYFAQLSAFGDANRDFIEIMLQQQKFAQEEKNAAIAVTVDAGNMRDIHPNRKEVVAKRLAFHALKRDYGFAIEDDDSPVMRSVEFANGEARVTFDHAKDLYVYVPDFSLVTPFQIAGEDGKWEQAEIANVSKDGSKTGVISGNCIVLRSDKVKEPKKVRYLVGNLQPGTVFNESNLPLGPFTTERR